MRIILLLGFAALSCVAQQQAPPAASGDPRPEYTLGPDDQILVRAPNVEEINEKPFRVEADGNINLPLVGRVRAEGLTVIQLEAELIKRLKQFLREPRLTISVAQFRGDPVFVLGAFRSPGIYPLKGRRTLVEMLATSGGLQPGASQTIRVSRKNAVGKIDLPNVVDDPAAGTNFVEISMASLVNSVNPAEDIPLEPYDVLSASKTAGVAVSGEVVKPGSVEMSDIEYIRVAQIISQAGGVTKDGDEKKVVILRPVLHSNNRARIEVNMAKVIRGEANDVLVLPGDVVHVPRKPPGLSRYRTAAILVASPLITAAFFAAFQH